MHSVKLYYYNYILYVVMFIVLLMKQNNVELINGGFMSLPAASKTSLENLRTFIYLVLITPFLLSCGGGGGGGAGGAASPQTVGVTTTPPSNNTIPTVNPGANQGQVLLGPIVDATVSVYRAESFNGVPICTVITGSESNPAGPGVINLSTCPIAPGVIYILIVTGGNDIDVNDDKIRDSVPTPKRGTLRALINGSDILAGGFRINILTEIAYQSVKDTLLTGGGAGEIRGRLDSVAKQLLKEDLNGDGIIDNKDLLDFSPVVDAGSISGQNSVLINKILAAILSGNRGELTNLSRQFLLASLGEFEYRPLLGQTKNFIVADFLVENGYLYAAGFEADSPEFDLRILIIDVRDFSNIKLAGQVIFNNLPANPQRGGIDMVKVGNYLYLVSAGSGMIVADVTVPTAPVASLQHAGRNFRIVTSGANNQLYVSAIDPNDLNLNPESVSLSIFSISNPATPSLVRTFPGELVTNMEFIGGYLYSQGYGGLSVFDARTPGNLTLLDTLWIEGGVGGSMVYKDGFIYTSITDTANRIQGIGILNVTNPSDIRLVDTITGSGNMSSPAIQGNLLFAGEFLGVGSSALTTFEITAPGKLSLRDSRSAPQVSKVIPEGDRVYTSGTTKFIAYNIAALNNRSTHTDFIDTPKTANHVEVIGNVAYVADNADLLSIDVSTPGRGLRILDSVSTGGLQILDMKVAGNYAYLALSIGGWRIINISNPADLIITGSNDEHALFPCLSGTSICAGETKTIAVQGNFAYTYTGSFPTGRLGKFLISNPTNPTLSAELNPINLPITDLAINGNHLYGVSGSTFAVHDAGTLASISRQNLLAKTIEIDGQYAYTSSSTSGLSILNVGTSSSPILFGGQLGLGIGNAVSVSGDVAYVANEFGMVEVYDVSNKISPEFIGIYQISGTVRDVFATQDYIYAVNGFGLIIEPAVKLQSVLN